MLISYRNRNRYPVVIPIILTAGYLPFPDIEAIERHESVAEKNALPSNRYMHLNTAAAIQTDATCNGKIVIQGETVPNFLRGLK